MAFWLPLLAGALGGAGLGMAGGSGGTGGTQTGGLLELGTAKVYETKNLYKSSTFINPKFAKELVR